LTINDQPSNKEDLVEIMWRAYRYFPEDLWTGVNYVGNVNVKHDLEIKSNEEAHGAFIFSRLVRKVRKMKNGLGIEDLLLAVTHDPVIIMYHRFELKKFKRIVDLVHDYVSDDVGILSLFKTDEEVATKIAAHGLGHNQGLTHHAEPIDLMYVRLLKGDPIRIDGFCIECQQKLKKKQEKREDMES
jgi:hypothetical protein